MKLWGLLVCIVLLGVAVQAADIKQLLSPDDPTDRAILAYLLLAEEERASATELTDLGVLLANRGFPKDAEKALRAAVKADKASFDASYRLGLLLQQQDKSREAAQALERAVKLRPTDPYATFMLAAAEERSGREKRAVRSYVRAFRLMPELADGAKNPLILDSALRLRAQIQYYRQVVGSTSYDLVALDPEAVELMMKAQPPAAAVPPTAEMPPDGVAEPEASLPTEPISAGGPP